MTSRPTPEILDRISLLIEAYWQASATPEEEAELINLLSTFSTLPAEMDADRKAILAIHHAHILDASCPPDLEHRILSTTCDVPSKRKFLPMLRISAAAACFIALIWSAIWMSRDEEPTTLFHSDKPAKFIAHTDTVAVDTTFEIENTAVIKPIDEKKVANISIANVLSQSFAETSAPHVSDSAYVAEITQEAFDIINSSLSGALRQVGEAERTLNSSMKTINKLNL